MFRMILLPVIPVFFIFCSAAQQVPRNKVFVEMFVGTNEIFTPAAYNGALDLVQNDRPVAVVMHHWVNDPFHNIYHGPRASFNSLVGWPTAYFDGIDNLMGGGPPESSKYNDYDPIVNNRMSEMSDFNIQIFGTVSGNNIELIIKAEKVNNSFHENLRLYIFLTESNIPYKWFAGSEVSYANRLMVPDQFGTGLAFISQDELIFNFPVSLDPSWNADHCELVAVIQDEVNREVFQTTSVMVVNLQPWQENVVVIPLEDWSIYLAIMMMMVFSVMLVRRIIR